MEQDYIVQELDSVEFVRSSDGAVFNTMEDLIADEKLHEEDNNQFDFLFNNDSIRYFIKDNIVWFIGKDICDYLEFENNRKAIQDHVSENNKMLINLNDRNIEWINTVTNCYGIPSKGNPNVLCLTEQGIYELTRFSRMPKADKFYEWIHNRVLPNIRRTGTYMTPNTAMTVYNNPEKIKEIIEENARITRELEEANRRANTAERFLKTAKEEIEFDNVSIHDLKRIIDASDSEVKRIADQATFEAQAYKREKDIAWDKVGSLQVKNSDLSQRISYLESKLSENNIAYSNEHPKVEMCHVVKPMDNIDTILSRLIKK